MAAFVVGVLGVLLTMSAQARSIRLEPGSSHAPKVEIVHQSANGTTFEVTIPEVSVTEVEADGNTYVRLSLPGGHSARLDEGKPEVPQVAVLLAVPTGARVTAQVLEHRTRSFEVGKVYPLQPVPRVGDSPGPFVVDERFYETDAYYPASPFAAAEPGRWRDLSVSSVRVYPVRVNPAKGTIEVASRIRVRVDYAGGAYPRATTDWMATLYSRVVANFGQLHLRTVTDSPTGWDYLAVIYEDYAEDNDLEEYLAWIGQRGHRVRPMVVHEGITADALKDSIRAVYNDTGAAGPRYYEP